MTRTDPLQCLELLTGMHRATFLATRTLNELAYRNREKFHFASEVVLSQCYVDILSGSCKNSYAKYLVVENRLG